MSADIVYYSNRSNTTHKFVQKLGVESLRIPQSGDFFVDKEYVLFVPTYGSGNDGHSIPRPVANFLNVPRNRSLLIGVVGFGNTNFGEHFCKAATLISNKTGVPILARVELLGTPEDVKLVKERLTLLDEQL
jgi:protein involved in ribonucleotide reduction